MHVKTLLRGAGGGWEATDEEFKEVLFRDEGNKKKAFSQEGDEL